MYMIIYICLNMNLNILLNFFNYIIFIPMLIISSLMIFISNSWFTQWMIMEFNLIGFMSLMIFDKKMNSMNSMNYFLVQSFNSYIFIMFSMNLNFLSELLNNMFLFLINLCLLTKMGLPPFYIWYVKIMKYLNWMNLFFLMTIQKIIPLIILKNLINFKNLLIMKFNMLNIIYMSFLCALFGLNMMNLKMLMSYSSIIQMSWILMLMYFNELICLIYLLIYMFISLTLILILNKFNLNYLNNLNLFKFQYNWMNIFYFFIMFSMASIPPVFGFMLKWISIQSMFYQFTFFSMLIMIFNSLISMFFYLRLMFIMLMNLSMNMKLNFLNVNFYVNEKFNLLMLVWFMLMMLLLYEIF
uniref:NADH-ubiquinone oxidoreductase chain 2 n=1 Tax=Eurytoma sp. ZJUH_2016013 TaxID=2491157 RepID=A0A3S5HLP2_9HYME|nr:NADH dehydrogenase subunit 2 [Eurytoma sp. ZJUH_2016013]